ncbi:hypothetical protein PR048_027027 [Dryococelus australis]|uniref:PiggyBac transposable element-derived protein domain-containing protein n=1 Tax=Dryococelus australis TaxID=614101 RepID=A0ABQ9GMY0_9NEOP|nr:hypothetical protein PR048_027027 [Dryococelus australis]
MFIENCQKNYAMGAHGCVDEILVPFRFRVRFLIHMPKEPAKYGIKLLCLTDAHISYLYNVYIYTGKGSDGATLTAAERKLQIPSQAVVRLTKCLYKTNRNITCDNWFRSLEIAQELLKHGLIPPEFLPNKTRAVGTSLYCFTKELTQLPHVPKKSNVVTLLSSMHHSEFNDTSTGKSKIISFYNATIYVVDTLDMKCSNCSTNRKTRSWPPAIFYYILAMCRSNASTPFMKKRLTIPNLPDKLRKLIQEAVGENKEKGAALSVCDKK